MESGFYIARFRTPMDENAGVIIVEDQVVKGGDSAYYYSGNVTKSDGDSSEVRLKVIRHTQPDFPVFGDLSQFTLALVGKKVGGQYKFEGRAERVSGLKFEAVLDRIQE
jgi:hypothetical protein